MADDFHLSLLSRDDSKWLTPRNVSTAILAVGCGLSLTVFFFISELLSYYTFYRIMGMDHFHRRMQNFMLVTFFSTFVVGTLLSFLGITTGACFHLRPLIRKTDVSIAELPSDQKDYRLQLFGLIELYLLVMSGSGFLLNHLSEKGVSTPDSACIILKAADFAVISSFVSVGVFCFSDRLARKVIEKGLEIESWLADQYGVDFEDYPWDKSCCWFLAPSAYQPVLQNDTPVAQPDV